MSTLTAAAPDVLGGLRAVVASAQQVFRGRMQQLAAGPGLTPDAYARYLTMQYHLTRDVQQPLLAVAAHPALAGKRGLRDFLYRFALEEEPHFSVAERDLLALGQSPGPCPLDVELWRAYFDAVIPSQPFQRLGGTSILENLGSGAADLVKAMVAQAAFLRPDNTRFLVLHLHETSAHGDEVLAALAAARLTDPEAAQLELGARRAAVMYQRMLDCVLGVDPLAGRLLG